MIDLIKDNRGFVSLIDTMLSIFILLMVLMAFNLVADIEIPSLSEESHDFKTSQDIMEIMSSKIDARDHSILERISYTLDKNNNSASSKREVKAFLDDYFASYLNGNQNQHYAFAETKQLDGEVLSSNGDYASAENLDLAIRDYGNYSYKLYLF